MQHRPTQVKRVLDECLALALERSDQGLGILMQPAVSTGIWNRVAGDVMDLAALGFAAKDSPKNKAVWGALAFVVGATLLDIVTARGLDKQTGKIWPVREHLPAT